MCHLALSRPREEAHIWVTLCSPPPPRPRARRGAHCTLGTGPHRSPRPRPNPGPRWIFSVRRSRRQPSRCVLGGRQRVLCQAEECFLSAPLSGPCPSCCGPRPRLCCRLSGSPSSRAPPGSLVRDTAGEAWRVRVGDCGARGVLTARSRPWECPWGGRGAPCCRISPPSPRRCTAQGSAGPGDSCSRRCLWSTQSERGG